MKEKNVSVQAYRQYLSDNPPDCELAVEEQPEWLGAVDLILTKDGSIKNTYANVVTLMKAAPSLKGRIYRDAMTGRIMLLGVPWNVYPHQLEDEDIYHLRWFFDRQFGISDEKNIRQAVAIRADQNLRHPIRDWLAGLEPWDGISRIGLLFPRYLGADVSEYTTAVTKLLLFAMIQRVRNPGCKFDYCIILVDTRQGTGKSTMCRLLAIRNEWFRDAVGDLRDSKETFEAICGAWVVELGELIATRRTKEVEAIKAYFSRTEDVYRTPYSTYSRRYPRQCVFIGTTNRPQFLPDDKTGNRRFIPIICDGDKADVHPLEDEAETKAFITQCFAEALVLGEAEGWPLTLDRRFDKQLSEYRDAATPEDSRIGRIQNYLDNDAPDKVCTQMVWEAVFASDGLAMTRRDLQEIAEILSLKVEGWQRYQGNSKGNHKFRKWGSQRAWERVASRVDSGTGFTPAPDDIGEMFAG